MNYMVISFLSFFNIYLEKRFEKIQICENHSSIWWFTLLDIANDDKMNMSLARLDNHQLMYYHCEQFMMTMERLWPLQCLLSLQSLNV